jgi:DNA-binding response OmpR family regulator
MLTTTNGPQKASQMVDATALIEDAVKGEEALNAARKIGADGQIKKPFAPSDLLALTDAALMQEMLID